MSEHSERPSMSARSHWILAAALLLGCRDDRPATKHADEHGAEGHHDEDAEGEHTGPQEVRIAPDMIRDLRVTTVRAEARAAGERVSVLGELRVDQDAYAEVAATTPARVVRVLAHAGDVVKAGQPLVELSSADAGSARAAAKAAESRVALAREQLERKRGLAADRLVAEREVIEAEAALRAAEADREVAAAGARPYASGVLRAPVAGTVIDRDVVVGQLADPSRTLFRIGDLSRLWLVAHVFERDAVRVRIGGSGTATFPALPGRTVEGAIAWIGHEVDASSRTIPVRLELPNPDGVLRPGMSATVSLPLGDPGGAVVAVPLASVQRVGDGWAVFVPRGEGVFEIRPIGRGRDLAGAVEVLNGVAAGDEIVVDGAFLLKAEADKARGGGEGDHDH